MTAGNVPVLGTLPSFLPIFAGVVLVFGTSPAPPPNSRTGSGRVRAMSMVAVRHSPISTLGAQGRAFCMSIGGVDVRLFGEKWMLVGTVDRYSFGTAFAARLVTTILVIR